MKIFPFTFFALGFVCCSSAADLASPLSAEQIMKKVAENQDRDQAERAHFVYQQSVYVTTRRTNGKLAREERSELLITPTVKGTERKQQSIKGRYWYKGQYLDFNGEPVPHQDGLDGSLVTSFRDDLTKDDSKDGIAKDLFPLTTDEQKDLRFELAGEKLAAGRKAYVIRFTPKDKDDLTWAGEALIDEEEFQPVSVYTGLSRRIPWAVRTLLGTDVPGLGFHTQYTRVDKDVWFPASFGTEFRLHAVFFINRTITVSLQNKNFQRATVQSEIRYEGEPPK